MLADEQPLRRMGALVAGADIRYPMPGTGHHVPAGAFAPDLTLHTDQGITSVAELMHPARPILLDLPHAQEPNMGRDRSCWAAAPTPFERLGNRMPPTWQQLLS
ncbi:hypothetical protein ABGB18_44270 [Nonomuraea sp. B12E4]|uniref:aromatic-ring hydroxylase C-terminal domain-containing protein n=1 Tax=Nonomuraea sp. B12E4 TaxID=3153564 RepID=UPI00325C43CF